LLVLAIAIAPRRTFGDPVVMDAKRQHLAVWHLRRDPRTSRPLARVGRSTAQGIPLLRGAACVRAGGFSFGAVVAPGR
jgi:hypothetical protein